MEYRRWILDTALDELQPYLRTLSIHGPKGLERPRRPSSGLLAIEVKLADRVEDADTKHLHWLRERVGVELIDAAVVYAGEHAYRRRDGVAVIPLALLGP